jgi:hypothetical protein
MKSNLGSGIGVGEAATVGDGSGRVDVGSCGEVAFVAQETCAIKIPTAKACLMNDRIFKVSILNGEIRIPVIKHFARL